MLKLYVWEGTNVLQRYGTGLAVTVANSVEEAFENLKKEEYGAWADLYLGYRYCFDEYDMQQRTDDREPMDHEPVQPKIYDLKYLPTLILWGGE